jgi:putative FmdB family regulatory protein
MSRTPFNRRSLSMADYEFECKKCEEQFEVHQTFAEHDREPKPTCPKCGSHDVEQLIEAVHVQTSKKS